MRGGKQTKKGVEVAVQVPGYSVADRASGVKHLGYTGQMGNGGRGQPSHHHCEHERIGLSLPALPAGHGVLRCTCALSHLRVREPGSVSIQQFDMERLVRQQGTGLEGAARGLAFPFDQVG